MSKAANKAFKKAAGLAISATSNILSAPSRMKAKRDKGRADRDIKTIKRARQFPKNVPNIQKGKITEAGKARSARAEVVARRNKKK